MINQFLVEDLNGCIVEVAYLCSNPKQIWLVMIEDVVPEGCDPDLFYKPDQIMSFNEYSKFSIEVFQELARTYEEMPWDGHVVTTYEDFMSVLSDAEVIEYDSDGHPYFVS